MGEPAEPRVADLLAEFESEYLSTSQGQEHLATYRNSREQARTNWAQVQEASRASRDVTDLVLEKLLPHYDSPHNRSRETWRHIAPVITRDLKKWFETTGWAGPSDWPSIAREILTFVERSVESPDDLGRACREFGASRFSRGFQSAFLSPILNALRPQDYLVLNTKTFATLRHLTDTKYSRRISAYPTANHALWNLHDTLEPRLREIAGTDVLSTDVLDQFCHWLIAIKKPRSSRGEVQPGAPQPKIDRVDAQSAAAVVSRLYADDNHKAVCLRFLADAIQRAGRYGSTRWSIVLYRRGVRLIVGRLLAFELLRERVRMGLELGRADQATRDLITRESKESDGFATIPPTALYALPVPAFVANEDRVRPLFVEFLGVAAGTARRTVSARSHSPGVITYLEEALDLKLPRPAHDPTDSAEPSAMPKAVRIQTPRTVFKKVDYDLSGLLTYIDNGDIGLPDIQRPFVWSAAKVRDLFDSMYRGFPVGYLLFWENSEIKGTKVIGLDAKARHIPSLLIVDGQQRLTSLYAVLRGKPVLDKDFRPSRVEIAFRPRDGRFEVSDAAIRLDPEFIDDISRLWTSNRSSYSIVNDFLQSLREKRTVTSDDEEVISHNLDRLFDLQKYPFTALEVTPSVDEEAVADIFVRINSEGVTLKQADFILTLLSVFWDEGRAQLEAFSRESRQVPQPGGPPSPFNYLIEPDPSQILRAAIAVGFHRARLQAVYQVLRGKDIETGQFSPERRDAQFARLKEAQEAVVDLTHWHQFLGCLTATGFRSGAFISSETALMYTYAFYLLGKQRGVEGKELQRLIARWYFMAALTSRYTGSAETTMEADLARVRNDGSPTDFVETLEKVIADTLTTDYWTITLPNDLESSSSRSPAWLVYIAAQNRLGTPVLFSDKRIWEAMDPGLRAKKKALDAHHLFPRAWLEKNGYPERRHFNQVANFAHLEWPDNIRIGASPPEKYVPGLKARFSPATWERMGREHALPDRWEQLDYPEFLRQRRVLMAEVIRNGFEELAERKADPDIHDDVSSGTASEQHAWSQIETLELLLRRKVRERYSERWGTSADGQIRAVLGDQAWGTIERNQSKYRSQYRGAATDGDLEILDFCYLGQLGQLMTANQAWDMFRQPFRDKRELEDLIGAIVPVRNDSAHFRSAPEKELTRCRLAIGDLMEKLS